jgi:stage V sporulation protein AD
MLEAGLGKHMLVGVSSHFSAAEKQFRLPLGMGSQRTPTASTTVTGGAAVIVSTEGQPTDPRITAITTGKMIDLGITDPANMGAAMAPAAVSTLITHFKALNIQPDHYDMIVTGDLGHVGHQLVHELMAQEGYPLSSNYTDCGILIFDQATQDTHNGGSGPGCCGVTLAGHLLAQLRAQTLKKVLFVPTGALLSLTSSQQALSIPGSAHAVAIEV